MALLNSATFSGKNGTKFQLQLHYDYSQDIGQNYTYLVYSLYFVSLGYSGQGSATRGYINGSEVGNTTSLAQWETKLLGQQAHTIWHNADGTFPAQSYSASISSPWGIGTASVSGVLSGLPTIPRTSSISAPNMTVGKTSTITINRATASFTHNVYYSWNGSDWIQFASNVGDSCQFTPPTSFYSAMSGQSATVRFACNTYYGSSYIGQSQTSATVYVDSSVVKPDVSATIIDTNKSLPSGSTTNQLTGSTTKFIKYISNASVSITAIGKEGATISSYSMTNGSTTLSTQTGTLQNISNNKITVNARDSRGLDNPKEYTLDILDYIPLSFTGKVERNLPTDGKVKVKIDGDYFNATFGEIQNTLGVKYRFKETNGSYGDYANLTPTITENKFSIDTIIEGLDYEKNFIIEITATDKAKQVSIEYSIQKGIPEFFISQSNLEFKGIPLIDSGSNENGDYIKLYDGTLICNGYKKINATIGAGTGQTFDINLPINMLDANYTPTCTKAYGGSGYANLIENINSRTTSKFTIYIWNNGGAQSTQDGYYWIAIGRWK